MNRRRLGIDRAHLGVALALVLTLTACASDDAGPPARRAAMPTIEPATTTKPASATEPAPATEPALATEPDADAAASEGDVAEGDVDQCAQTFGGSRTDVTPRGNRLSRLVLDLATAPITRVQLPSEPAWVITHNRSWHVALVDGTAVTVSFDGQVEPTEPLAGPPVSGPNGLVSAYAEHELFDAPLPDTRVVYGGQHATELTPSAFSYAVALTEPTDRYGHGVLGDAIEASAIQLVSRCSGDTMTIAIETPDVIEGISAMLGDINGNNRDEILVTVSNGSQGARLAVYDMDGELIAESPPIGRGNRWRNQLAIAPLGPAGEVEVVDVRTPHIGGTVEYFRLEGDALVRVAASDDNYTSHSIGSRNLDLAIVGDATDDGRLEVIVPTSDRRSLAVLSRTPTGVEEVASVPLNAPLATNLSVGPSRDTLIFGTADANLVIMGPTPTN